ncbi:hypothetical protein CNR27_03895 [Luteimonas chenhongjianii]|uniref:DUF2897 domain-containing protein n=2 Tax=Lysobacteraceae TaxID=32033 RepID=A0A290XC79_9GAMM|nr:hypothetical protein CNR27_03895 [Luteimonas chenhongjianii]RPD83892.1 hypothetical protein EGK76_14225 [Luteimonas sp. 100069]
MWYRIIARKQADMYDWFPIVFIVFKVVVLGTGMFFAIKWHHDQAKKDAQEKKDADERKRNEAGGG